MSTKIIHLIPRIAYTGGIENYVRTLCINQLTDDYEITICTFLNDNSPGIKDELLIKGIKIISLKKCLFEKVDNRYLRFFLKNSLFAYITKWISLKKILNKEKFDLLISHGEDSELITSFTNSDIKKINVIHGEAYFPANPFYRILLQLFGRKRYNFTIVVNRILAKIPEKLDVKHAIVPPGINVEQFEQAQHQIDLQAGVIKIGYIGRVVKDKGVFELLEAFYLLKKKHKKVQLKIAGDGKALISLKKKAKEYGLTNDIEFFGEVSSSHLFYKEIDVLVLPSFTEGLPITILEAMASGVLIIASNVGGISEVIENNVNGILLDKVEPEQIAKIVDNIIRTPYLLEKFSKNALNDSLKYNFSNTVNLFYQVINSQFINSD